VDLAQLQELSIRSTAAPKVAPAPAATEPSDIA
jgi:hypothetical protein